MTSKNLETISDLLSRLHGHAYFRPEGGPLMESLTQAVLDAVDGELAEELSEGDFDIEVSIGRQEGESELTLDLSVDRPGVVHTSQIALTRLADAALEDLAGYLTRLAEAAAPIEASVAGGNVVRKKPEGEHHEKEAASARLKVSPEWLKSVVPCTDYSYDEIDGKKFIREYYWSKDLIERLFRIKSTKTTPEDLQFVADECCEGDQDWARDLIARLKSPNRPEAAPRDQSQKNQGRPGQSQGRAAQNQARPAQGQGRPGQNQGKPAQGQGQGKPGQNQGKPAQGQGRPAQNQGRPAQEQGTPAAQGQVKPAHNQAKAGQTLHKPAQPKTGPGERVRSRSRHKKPFREPGSDAAGKPESAAAPKPPQS
jgi:hypothetical protein